MAINKNFVIKNGVEVNTNLLVGDSTLNKVGIGTTVPEYTLHIGVGDGARGGIGVTDIHVSGIATIGVANSTSGALSVTGISTFEGLVDANGGISARTAAVQDLTDNRVVIAGSGGELEDSGNLTFDGSTLTVTGDLDPTNVSIGGTLQVTGVSTFLSGVIVSGIGTFENDVDFKGASADITFDQSANSFIFDDNAAAKFGTDSDMTITHSGSNGSITNGTGDLNILSSNNVKISHQSSGEDYATFNEDGAVELFFNGAKMFQTTGIGITVGLSTIQHNGNAAFAGIVTVGSNLLVGGDLTVTGDYVVDEISARNLTLTGIATIPTIAGNTNITGVTTTGENLGGFKRLVGAASSTVVSIAVTVASKTADHRYFGQGSGNGYWLDGVQSPFLTLVPGKLYYFDQSHSTNSGHPLRFYLEQDKANQYTTEITSGGTPGSSGAYTQIGIGTASNENNHPAVLHYQCTAHALMGNAVATQSNAVNLPDSSAATIRANLTVNGDIDLSGSIDVDGTANIDVLDVDEGANIAGGLVANSAQISDLTDNRVVIAGSSGELEDSGNLTFDGSTLGITGNIDLSADIDVDGTANLDVLDVDGASNFGADVVFAGAGANITFDQSEDDLIFEDDAQAIFGDSSDLKIYHNGSHSFIQDSGTGALRILSNLVAIQNADGTENSAAFNENGAVELFHDNVKIFQTTGAGVTVGLSSIQHNGNAAFPGITTLGKPGAGSEVIINNRLTVNSGANITGIATLAQAYITKLAQSNGTSGNANEIPVANGSGGWNWQPVNTTGAGDITGITVREEGSNVGTANSITIINFVGNDVTADATQNQGICTVTIDSNIQGITTSGTSFFHDITQTGVTTITSDQEEAINVGTSATIYKLGNIRTVGVITARGGLVLNDSTDRSSGGGLIVGTAASIATNGNAGFAGIVTAGGGFNIGIQSAGIVIAKNVGINTLNFVGSGNSITYFAATNTLDVSIAGSSGGGGVSETSTSVSSTSPTSTGSFAKASKRSASVLAQITQGSAYQVGRYLVIHDGTTVTTVEESAVATGSMLGTFEGVINGDDVEFRVTMNSSSGATIKTKIDTLSS